MKQELCQRHTCLSEEGCVARREMEMLGEQQRWYTVGVTLALVLIPSFVNLSPWNICIFLVSHPLGWNFWVSSIFNALKRSWVKTIHISHWVSYTWFIYDLIFGFKIVEKDWPWRSGNILRDFKANFFFMKDLA